MKVSISQTTLNQALSIVQKALSTHTTMPILGGIYIETKDDNLLLQSTDLELSIQCSVPALIEESGKAVLPGKLIADIVKNLPDTAVHISSDTNETVISCDLSSFSVRCLDPFDYPAFPEVVSSQSITIPFDDFALMAKKVCRVVSRDESRPILTGVLLEVENDSIRMVATDSYRLALAECPYTKEQEDFSAVISGSFLSDLSALPQTGEDITLSLAENQIIAKYNNTVFINRRIEGVYPNYRQLIPTSTDTICTFKKDAILSALRRASLLEKQGSQVKISVNKDTNTVLLSSTAKDIGSTQETVKCEVEGNDVDIAFNSHYVIEGLSSIDKEELTLEIQTSLKPGVFKTAGEKSFLYLVMPVRM